nr:DUF998 domain-containing protein [Candidatus Sigynarchaeota archaeon]
MKHESANQLHWYSATGLRYIPKSTIEALFQETLEHFIQGKYPKKTMFQKLFPLSSSVYAGLMLAAWLLFPGTYSLTTNTISDLGNPVLNPTGYLCFSIAFIYLAFMMIPFYQFIHKRLQPIGKILSRIALIINMVGSCGFIALALFPNTAATLRVHLPAAIVSFGGLVFGGLLYWVIIVKDAIVKTGTKRVIPIAGALTNIVVGVAVIQLMDISTFTIKNAPATFIAPWEWTLFFSIGASIIMLFRSMPEIQKKMTIYKLIEEKTSSGNLDAKILFANRLPAEDRYGPCTGMKKSHRGVKIVLTA